MDPSWLRWAKGLQAIAQNGLTYATDAYDTERNQAVREVAAEMMEKIRDPEFLGKQPDAFRDYVMPQLTRLGIITERTAPKYRELGFEV